MKTPSHPRMEDISLDAVLAALSDPVRRQVVEILATEGEKACGSFGLPLTKATMSHHFKVLREAGIVYTRVEGTQRINTLRRDELNVRFPCLLDAVLQASKSSRCLVNRSKLSPSYPKS